MNYLRQVMGKARYQKKISALGNRFQVFDKAGIVSILMLIGVCCG